MSSSSTIPLPVLPKILHCPGSESVQVVLPGNFDEKDLSSIHNDALRLLTDSWEIAPNTSIIVDYAYLEQMTPDGPAVLSYHSKGDRRSHGRHCTHKSCLGYETTEEAAEHDSPPDDLLFSSSTDRYMCKSDETWSTKVLKDWETEHSAYRSLRRDHRLAKLKIVYPKDNPIEALANTRYAIFGNSPEIFDPTLVEDSTIPEMKYGPGDRQYHPRGNHKYTSHYSRYGDSADIQVARSSASHRSRNSSVYTAYRCPMVPITDRVKEQEVKLGVILARRMSDTRPPQEGGTQHSFGKARVKWDTDLADNEWPSGQLMAEHYTSRGKRFHHHSETNPFCRGWVSQANCENSSSRVSTSPQAKLLNGRCRPGEGYNFEEDWLMALWHNYEKEREKNPELVFEDSQTARLTSLFPQVTSFFLDMIKASEDTDELPDLRTTQKGFDQPQRTETASTPGGPSRTSTWAMGSEGSDQTVDIDPEDLQTVVSDQGSNASRIDIAGALVDRLSKEKADEIESPGSISESD